MGTGASARRGSHGRIARPIDSRFMRAVSLGSAEDMISALKEGANINAVLYEDPFYYLLGINESGVDIRYEDGLAAIHLASLKNHAYIVEFLLSQPGTDVNLTDNCGRNALHIQMEFAHKTPSRLIYPQFLERGLNLHARDNNGSTLLHACASCHERNLEFGKLLIKKGVDVNVVDKEGNTAMHALALTAAQGRVPAKTAVPFAELLVDCGLNIHACNKAGKTALEVVASKEFTDLAGYLTVVSLKQQEQVLQQQQQLLQTTQQDDLDVTDAANVSELSECCYYLDTPVLTTSSSHDSMDCLDSSKQPLSPTATAARLSVAVTGRLARAFGSNSNNNSPSLPVVCCRAPESTATAANNRSLQCKNAL